MKKLTWQQWTAIAIILAVIVVAVVLHLVQPQISFAFMELTVGLAFVLGGVVGYLLKTFKKEKLANNESKEKELLKD